MKSVSYLLNFFKFKAALTTLSLASAALTFTAESGCADDQVPFRAAWGAQIQIAPLVPPVVSVTGAGTGHGLHLGQMVAQSVVEVVNLATGEGAASYRFTAANGDAVLVDFVFTAVPTGSTTFSVHGVWQITGGTGRFNGASGSGHYLGQVEFSGPATAVGRFELEGTLSSPGRLKQGPLPSPAG